MRFTYRRIETALDRISRSKESSNSNCPEKPEGWDARGGKPTNSLTSTKWYRQNGKFWFWFTVGIISIFIFGLQDFRLMAEKNKKRFERVRVTIHEEPLENHVWLEEKLIEIKTKTW